MGPSNPPLSSLPRQSEFQVCCQEGKTLTSNLTHFVAALLNASLRTQRILRRGLKVGGVGQVSVLMLAGRLSRLGQLAGS